MLQVKHKSVLLAGIWLGSSQLLGEMSQHSWITQQYLCKRWLKILIFDGLLKLYMFPIETSNHCCILENLGRAWLSDRCVLSILSSYSEIRHEIWECLVTSPQ